MDMFVEQKCIWDSYWIDLSIYNTKFCLAKHADSCCFFLIKNGETVIQGGPLTVVNGGWGYNPTKKGAHLVQDNIKMVPSHTSLRSILKDEISVSYNCGVWTTASRVDPGKNIRKSVSKHISCCSDIIPVERLGSLAFCKMFLEQVVEN